jgi:hypothetical protein
MGWSFRVCHSFARPAPLCMGWFFDEEDPSSSLSSLDGDVS